MPTPRTLGLLLALLALCAAMPGLARATQAEAGYFVAPDGDDASDGRSRRTPFATLQRALDLAQPGETIHLAPGRYLQDARSVRDGTAEAPITIRGPRAALLSGSGERSRILEVNHDHHHLIGFSIDGLADPALAGQAGAYRDKLLYVIGVEPYNGVTGLRVLRMRFQNAGGECLRIRYFATQNEVGFSEFFNCGQDDFPGGVYGGGGKNGEAIYLGTSNNQWGQNGAPTADPDATNDNWIHHNLMNTQGNECVDIKEGSTGNIVEHNDCSGQKDTESAGFDSRGDGNIFRYNKSYDNLGAGVRIGGARVNGYQYGVNNQIYGNELFRNAYGAIKIMVIPQGQICGNTLYDNGPGRGSFGGQFDPAAPCP